MSVERTAEGSVTRAGRSSSGPPTETTRLSSGRPRIRDTALEKLHPNELNPRRISDERLKALMRSIEAEPGMLYARPVVALPDGTIIAGNMRWRACKELGRATVPAVRVDLDDERAKLWLLRDNNEYGEWEDEALATLLAELQAADVDLDLSGFGADAIDALLASLEPAEIEDQGAKLAALKVSIADPEHVVEPHDHWLLYQNARPAHSLFIESVYSGFAAFSGHVGPEDLFVPYPSPIVPLTERARERRLVMVQPDAWLAGHLLDKYAQVHGPESVRKHSTKVGV